MPVIVQLAAAFATIILVTVTATAIYDWFIQGGK